MEEDLSHQLNGASRLVIEERENCLSENGTENICVNLDTLFPNLIEITDAGYRMIKIKFEFIREDSKN